MSSVENVDPVLNMVKRSARQFGMIDEGPLGQQILLLGDTFYGYRFTSKEFIAVWSVADQTINFFDHDGKQLGASLMSVDSQETVESQGTIRLSETPSIRKAA